MPDPIDEPAGRPAPPTQGGSGADPSLPSELDSGAFDTAAERAGELLHRAVQVARQFPKPDVIWREDPRDNTPAALVVSPAGVTVLDPAIFDAYRQKPLWREGVARLTTLQSFIDLTVRFQVPETAIFARDDMTSAKLTTVFDYHPADGTPRDAGNLKHSATYAFPFSDEWKAWTASNGKAMSMADFAAFLEDRIGDVSADAAPTSEAALAFVAAIGGRMASPSKLIELARGLQVYENSVIKEARNLSSGEGQLTFESAHVDATGAPLTVPNLFMIEIPVFARDPDHYRLLARLRYRKAPGGLVFWYDLWRLDLVFEAAFTDALETVREGTEVPIYIGAPEA